MTGSVALPGVPDSVNIPLNASGHSRERYYGHDASTPIAIGSVICTASQLPDGQ